MNLQNTTQKLLVRYLLIEIFGNLLFAVQVMKDTQLIWRPLLFLCIIKNNTWVVTSSTDVYNRQTSQGDHFRFSAHGRNQQSLNTTAPSIEASTFQPSSRPSIQPSLRPTRTSSPSVSQVPSSYPSIVISTSPSSTTSPSTTRSSSPSISTNPSIKPSNKPSFIPSTIPSYSLKNSIIQDLEMVIEGIDTELKSSVAQDDWRNVTSSHVLQYWKQENYGNFYIKTYIERQDIIKQRINEENIDRGWYSNPPKSISVSSESPQGAVSKQSMSGGAVKIIYFQEIEIRNASITAELCLDPFTSDSDRQQYINLLRSKNTIFDSVTNLTIRVLNTNYPSVAPTDETSIEITSAPVFDPSGGQQSQAIIALSSILGFLIIMMVCIAIWFIFIHNRGDAKQNRLCSMCSRKGNNQQQSRSTPRGEGEHLFPVNIVNDFNEYEMVNKERKDLPQISREKSSDSRMLSLHERDQENE